MIEQNDRNTGNGRPAFQSADEGNSTSRSFLDHPAQFYPPTVVHVRECKRDFGFIAGFVCATCLLLAIALGIYMFVLGVQP